MKPDILARIRSIPIIDADITCRRILRKYRQLFVELGSSTSRKNSQIKDQILGSASIFSMSSFKVIVVGAGTTGLVLAHALQASKIDYVLVEQRSQIVPERPFGVNLWPQVLRILHQLGLQDAIERIAQPMVCTEHQTMQGKHLYRDPGFSLLEGVCVTTTMRAMVLFNLHVL